MLPFDAAVPQDYQGAAAAPELPAVQVRYCSLLAERRDVRLGRRDGVPARSQCYPGSASGWSAAAERHSRVAPLGRFTRGQVRSVYSIHVYILCKFYIQILLYIATCNMRIDTYMQIPDTSIACGYCTQRHKGHHLEN